ncbi:alpha/beta hydrolase [uncultured Fibrobacter sp.]|jgi:alpha-beta hydrolase superfamily lysophospholipase|uniref:alpha/beta hydrolase n=1 Tax=uncultured Fibrobacter sp. TaxID=261512 RepID=UPI0026129ACB|nr:alpha/beta hydrolase [uncultured Fibrobacter sp.]
MKFAIIFYIAMVASVFAGAIPVPDPFLGLPFMAYSYDAGDSAKFHATLVHYPYGSVSRKADTSMGDSLAVSSPRASVLYIHGFNDYFFQAELAQKLDSAGYSFYAIDLHKYGRSLRSGETAGELRDISEYYAELDSAIAMIRLAEGDSVPLVLIGHSTGGLISCLYATDRGNGAGIAAVVLNSPFFEMNYVWPVRRLAVPALSILGSMFPSVGIPRSYNLNYDKSLYKSESGEWEYDRKLKVPGSLPIDLGWLHAIHQGHVRVQQGLKLTSPILVMHSGCSYRDDDWSEEYTYCDGVLDVEHIHEYGQNLGPHTQIVEIEGGLHDLFLSHRPARDNAYQAMFRFLDDRLATRPSSGF